MDKFCMKCGTELINNECPKCRNAQRAENTNNSYYQQFFSNPNEKYITSLGTSYISNYITYGTTKKGFLVVSDKRVYARGNCYEVIINGKGKRHLRKSYKSRTIDVKDVTGTGIDSFSEPLNLVYAILMLLLGVFLALCSIFVFSDITTNRVVINPIWVIFFILGLGFHVFFLFKWFQSQVECILVQYAGGEIAFDLQWFSEEELESFQRLIRIAKDQACTRGETEGYPAKLSPADELIKYSELLSAGIITQEEFVKMKQKVIDDE